MFRRPSLKEKNMALRTKVHELRRDAKTENVDGISFATMVKADAPYATLRARCNGDWT